jgi:asparagine synthase (glutamine-hydrolysing)
MCGISGFNGDFDEPLLHKMSHVIAHRGPDDSGVYWDKKKKIGLAHRRLSIIDTSDRGHQPMWDAQKKIVIVFNGEIYNYQELRSKLIALGYSFKSQSDTEVLIYLYLHFGTEMLTQLNGIFAFALWDTRTDILFIARDNFGVKPLYYSDSSLGFIFASELKSILQDPRISRDLNPHAIHYHLAYLWCPSPDTMLNSVKKLEPGHALIVKNGKVQKHWEYYDLPYDQIILPITEEDAIQQVGEGIKNSSQRQMISDVPVGAFLSGGLDSSAVVAFANKYTQGPRLQCFTIGFNDKNAKNMEGMIEDLPYAKSVAKHLDVDLHTIFVGSEMVNQLQKMIYHLDEPQADASAIHVLYICQLAKEHGIKVLLSGAGGDDIFTGYRRHYALMQENVWAWLPRSIRKALTKIDGFGYNGNPYFRRFAKAFRYADLEGDKRLISYLWWMDPNLQGTLYSKEFKVFLETSDVSSPLINKLSKLPKETHSLNRMLYLEGKYFLADHNLNYTDKMSMACGVEVRVPFLDPDLIDLAARLPISYKQRGRIGKWVLKKAMENYLPHEVIYRPKTGFGVPLRHWIQHSLRPLVEDILSAESLRKRGIFDPGGVDRLIRLDRSGRLDGSYIIFSLICIELWCRIFVDQPIPNSSVV